LDQTWCFRKVQLNKNPLYNGDPWNPNPVMSQPGIFALPMYCSKKKMCAMHIFSDFMRALALTQKVKLKAITEFSHLTTFDDESTETEEFVLKFHSTRLNALTLAVHEAGLCSQQEAHVVIVSALAFADKLPAVNGIIGSVVCSREKLCISD
jgi:hypothetical protein